MFHKDKLVYAGSQSFSDCNYQIFKAGPTLEPKDGKLRAPWQVLSCRDGMGATMREAIIDGTLPTDKLRLLFIWTNYKENIVEKWFLRGLRCLHAFEKLAGWPLTRAMKVDMPRGVTGVYCRGSRRWLKTPYLVTLYVLLVRMCADISIDGFKNFDGMMKIINSKDNWTRDAQHIVNTREYWKALALGYPYLFEQYKMTYYWSRDQLHNEGYGEGILKLCSGKTNFPGAYTDLNKVKVDINKNNKLTLERKKAKKKS